MRPYPKELRVRVVAAVEQGEYSLSEIASLFGVGTTFVKKMLRLHRAGDDLEPRHGGGPEPSLKEAERALLREQIADQPDASLEELQKVLAGKRQVSVSLDRVGGSLTAPVLPHHRTYGSVSGGS